MSPTQFPQDPDERSGSNWGQASKRQVAASWKQFVSTIGDPTLPLLILGVIAAAAIATLVFGAPAEIGFGILFSGGLTAVLETKMHNDRRDR